jgi:hypothetical protein
MSVSIEFDVVVVEGLASWSAAVNTTSAETECKAGLYQEMVFVRYRNLFEMVTAVSRR